MNKLQKEIKELRELADFIEANPKEYSQSEAFKCVVGLGAQLKKGVIKFCGDVLCTHFSERYGISYSVVSWINWGWWNRINKSFKHNAGNKRKTKASTAVRLIRFLADQKEAGVIF